MELSAVTRKARVLLALIFYSLFWLTTANASVIENEGVAPDIEVELEPEMVNRGVDTQLDRAIAEVLKQLRDHKTVKPNASPALPQRLGM